MPQLHLYVSQEVASKIKQKAESQGVSVSGYLAQLVRSDIGEGWPKDYFERVLGGWEGEPLVRQPQGSPEVREEL